TLLGKFVGVLLAFLAVGSMTLLQVDPTYAAAQVQTARVKVVLSRAQLAHLAQQTMRCTPRSSRPIRPAVRSSSRRMNIAPSPGLALPISALQRPDSPRPALLEARKIR